jgi:glycosyltransferase involved in cell wall biosynthesis
MNIVFLNATGQLGGAERMLICMLEALREARPDWTLQVVAAEDGPLIPIVLELGFDITILPLPPRLAALGEKSGKNPFALAFALPDLLQYRTQLRELLTRLEPDILHTLNFKTHVLGAWAKPDGAALCWHIHDFVSSRFFMSKMLRRLSRRPAAIIAISRAVAEDVRRVVRRPDRVYTVLNAINLNHFSPSGPATQLTDRVTVGLVATLARWKGHRVFFRALSLLPEPVCAYVVGGGLYRTVGSQYTLEELQDRAARSRVLDQVTFTGFIQDTAPIMRGLDIVVHASTKPEPFGLVIAEAMACGRAVIASTAGGVNEFLSPGENGLGHRPGDAAALAECIARLVSRPDLRRQYGEAARRTAEKLFQPSRLARQLIAVYEKSLP